VESNLMEADQGLWCRQVGEFHDLNNHLSWPHAFSKLDWLLTLLLPRGCPVCWLCIHLAGCQEGEPHALYQVG
jgi:hypothetical protein